MSRCCTVAVHRDADGYSGSDMSCCIQCQTIAGSQGHSDSTGLGGGSHRNCSTYMSASDSSGACNLNAIMTGHSWLLTGALSTRSLPCSLTCSVTSVAGARCLRLSGLAGSCLTGLIDGGYVLGRSCLGLSCRGVCGGAGGDAGLV